jgi:hypothetical protein
MDDQEQMRQAVERIHRCHATYRTSVHVNRQFRGQTAWAVLSQSSTLDNREASICFAWSASIPGSAQRRYYAILDIPPIESASDAVWASISAEHTSRPYLG